MTLSAELFRRLDAIEKVSVRLTEDVLQHNPAYSEEEREELRQLFPNDTRTITPWGGAAAGTLIGAGGGAAMASTLPRRLRAPATLLSVLAGAASGGLGAAAGREIGRATLQNEAMANMSREMMLRRADRKRARMARKQSMSPLAGAALASGSLGALGPLRGEDGEISVGQTAALGGLSGAGLGGILVEDKLHDLEWDELTENMRRPWFEKKPGGGIGLSRAPRYEDEILKSVRRNPMAFRLGAYGLLGLGGAGVAAGASALRKGQERAARQRG